MNRLLRTLVLFALTLAGALALHPGVPMTDADHFDAFAHFGPVNDGARFVCGGVLITWRHVLTAGHCKVLPGKHLVYLGSRKLCEAPLVAAIEKVDVHPSYDSETLYNDIAVVTLESGTTRMIKDSGLRPMKINWDASRLPLDTPTSLMGFGCTSDRQNARPVERARIGNSFISLNNLCGSIMNLQGDRHKELCFDGRDAIIYQGDSGGPVIHAPRGLKKGKLVGIISGGNGVAGGVWVATNVEAYKEWIEESTGQFAKWKMPSFNKIRGSRS